MRWIILYRSGTPATLVATAIDGTSFTLRSSARKRYAGRPAGRELFPHSGWECLPQSSIEAGSGDPPHRRRSDPGRKDQLGEHQEPVPIKF
jgi:hypothetical protein